MAGEEIEQAAQDQTRRIARLRQAALRWDTNPALLGATRRFRRALPGDDRFGDPLSTAGRAPVEMVARGVSALSSERESVVQELGLAGLQVWQSLSEATGRGRGERDLALLFTDLVSFSSWALQAGDAATLELLRAVGTAVESAILGHDGRIVKRLGDGVMASFLEPAQAVRAALDAQEAVGEIVVGGYRPKMRAGVHWGRPRKLGGDLIGVDVNIAARVGDAAKAEEVLASDAVLDRLDADEFSIGRRKRLRAAGAPRDLTTAKVARASVRA